MAASDYSETDGFTVEEAINSTELGCRHLGPIKVKEFRTVAGEDMKQMRADIDKALTLANMNTNGISRLESLLIGIDGKGGILERLDTGQEDIKVLIAGVKDAMQGLTNLHVSDVNELNKKIDSNSNCIGAMQGAVKSLDDKVTAHTDKEDADTESNRKKWALRSWDLFKTTAFLVMGAFAAKYLGV